MKWVDWYFEEDFYILTLKLIRFKYFITDTRKYTYLGD